MVKDFTAIIIAYIAALTAGFAALETLPFSLIVNALIADLIATCIIFAFARFFKNSSFYDAYWSVIPPLLALYWLIVHMPETTHTTRAYIVVGLIFWWGIRLTWNWASHWTGLSHEDWRYQPIRDKAGNFELLADFFSTHLLPTLIVFAALLPAYAVIMSGSAALGWLDYLAIIVTAGAILIETVSDIQLHRFNAIKKPGEIMKTGLWRLSRHPNYFGEWGFWFGLMLFGLAAHSAGWWWIVPGAVLMLLLIRFASIPMMDERSRKRRRGYAKHMTKTNAFIPWPPKK